MKEQDLFIESRRTEIANLESLISQSREGFNNQRSQRDKLQDERKYGLFRYYMLSFTCLFIVFQFYSSVYFHRALWGKETELSAEIDKLRTEVEKAEKSLDHATPGVRISSKLFLLIH